MHTVVVTVHGLWLQGYEAILLRYRLGTALAAETRSFAYPSVRSNLTDNALALQRFLGEIRADTLHLVGHSLGGLVILKLFELEAALPPGRIVLMGSPVRGCRSARRFALLPFGGDLLGLTASQVLLAPNERRWDGARDLGVIAGDLGFGLGRLLGPMGAPNDGTVLVEETVLAGATAQVRLTVSHMGMPFSAPVAHQTAAFLRDGRFDVSR